MSEQNIIQNTISRLGQTQDERLPPELGRHFVDVDEWNDQALLAQTAALAEKLRFYGDSDEAPSGDWSSFFPVQDNPAWLQREDGTLPPHLGLFLSFLRLYRHPQSAINAITGNHLDFQFREVLRFKPHPARPDRAHLVLELKKGAAPTLITTQQSFSGGKDARGVERIYEAVREVVVNHGKVAALHSVFRDVTRLRFAPIANSSDGLGGALDPLQPKWSAFGHAELPPAQIGFALASPVLRMQEGKRTIQLDLQLGTVDSGLHKPDALAGAFEAHITGPKGWLGPFSLSGSLAGDQLTLTAVVPATEPAIVDYHARQHGHHFAAQAPVLQLLLKPDASLHYADLERLSVHKGRITVEVDAVASLTLENDFGSLNPKKAFLPFGAQPVSGGRFMIGCAEALSKRLLDLKVKLTWQGAPSNLVAWYHDYKHAAKMANGVTVSVTYQDRSLQTISATADLMARNAEGATVLSPTAPLSKPIFRLQDWQVFGLLASGSVVGRQLGHRFQLKNPIHRRPHVSPPEVQSGFITVTLVDDFLHAAYRTESIAKALEQGSVVHAAAYTPIVLNEPYTPTVQAISLGYKAQSDEVDFGAKDLASFTNPDLQFFHVGCFGQMREHAFLRHQFDYLQNKPVHLLPAYRQHEFLIGVADVAAGDSLSLLMQVAEGSADPDLPPQELSWSVLSDNYWRPLTNREFVLDTSHGLRTSGIVALALPSETTTEHTVMPTGLVWIRATIPAHSAAVCQLVNVANNAVEVQFTDRGNDPAHLAQALPASSITKLKAPLVSVKQVSQPAASFGGHLQETSEMLTRRAAERLRHRNRCITPWDFERMLLQAFPEVHKVKCIPHASKNSWQAAGHVLLVVIPDLRNQNAVDPLRPRVDIDTLVRMREFAQRHCAMQAVVEVKNPHFQRVKLDFKVRFMPGKPFNFYSRELNKALVEVLSPWAFDPSSTLEFGGQVYRSVLLDFVEDLPYVDFATDFKLFSPDSSTPQQDLASISADRPDTILVSAASHSIEEVTEA